MKKLGIHQGRYIGMILLLTTSLTAPAADVEFYGVVKMQRFIQANATAPTLAESESEDGEPPFVFNAFVDLGSSNAVTSAILTLTGGAQRTLQLEESGFNREFFDGAEFKPDLDLIYANGTYTLTLQTRNDGNKSLPLTLPASDAYPNPPRINNFTAAQNVNAAQTFTLSWDAFAGGLVTDFIQLEIMEPDTYGTVFETSDPGEPDSLNGTSTSVQIPAGTLSPGRTYLGRMFFAKLVDMDDTTYGDGVTGVAGFLTETTFELRTTGGTDNQQPHLEKHSPFNMESGIKGNTVVAFTFNERMNTTLSLGTSVTWSGNVNAGLMNHSWSADGRTLFCFYPPGFPINAEISWQLNPGGSPVNLRDTAGNVLPSQSGSYNTGSETGAAEPDVEFLAFIKGRLFLQSGTVAEPAQLYVFSLTSDLNAFNSVTNGLVTLPSTRTVTPQLDWGDAYDFESAYSSQAQMDLFFPDGAYQVRLDTVRNGSRQFNFALNGSAYPNAPQIVNFAATQSVNPSNTFTLSWDAFAGGTAADLIRLEIEGDNDFGGEAFETPSFNEAGALRGTNTSVLIPAFTFMPGRTYRSSLMFVKVSQVDTSTYPGVVAASGYLSVTDFELRTIGEPIRPRLEISNTGNTARVTVIGERNRFYTVQSADDLSGNPIRWISRAGGVAYTNFNGFTASFEFHDPVPPGDRRFYRALDGSDFGNGGNQ